MQLFDWRHGVEDLPGALFINERIVPLGAARASRVLVLAAELTGKQATREGAPDDQPRLFRFQERNELAFEIAAGDGVVGLQRGKASEVLEFMAVVGAASGAA